MTPELWQKVSNAWDHYFDLETEERSAFLEHLRAEDAEVANELESLLAEQEKGEKEGLPELPTDLISLAGQQQVQDAVEEALTVDPSGLAESQKTEDSTPDKPKTPHPTLVETGELPDLIGSYKAERVIGRGGMGVVYKAHHQELNRTVAVKMILSGTYAGAEDVTRFLAEAEAVAALHHPNIVQIYEVGKHNGSPYMVLEYVSGGTLAHRLRGKPLLPRDAAEVVEQLARGMEAAHQTGLVHRDLKPGNVLLTSLPTEGEEPGPLGTAKITDFGLAKKIEGNNDLTRTGAVMGTPSYMAPEQAKGETKRVGPEADVYALGAILYECLTGRPPFVGPTTMDILMQVISNEPVPPRQLQPSIPRDLETICLKCLQKEPRQRYADAQTLAEDLQCFKEGKPIIARPVGKVERAVKWVKRNPAVASLVATVLLVLVLGTTISTGQAIRATVAEGEALEKERFAVDKEKEANLVAKQLKAKSIALQNELIRSEKLVQSEAKAKKEALKQLDFAQHTLHLSQLQKAAHVWQSDPYQALEYLHDYRLCPINRRCAVWRFYERQCSKWFPAATLN